MGRGGATGKQRSLFADYEGFVDKFKPKKTTDDCYTPPKVYEAVASWVAEEYGVDRASMLRPFRPGGDYQAEEYPEGCCVVDNPPFSILSQIVRFYLREGVPFFLFAPALTLFSGVAAEGARFLTCDCDIVYENGASVRTSFVTSLGDCLVRTAPDLTRRVMAAVAETQRERKGEPLPKYAYPYELLTSARGSYLSKWGVDFRVPVGEACFVRALDSQKAAGKAVFGGGLLLSERAAAERAAAERAAAERAAAKAWELSDRERAMQRMLGRSPCARGTLPQPVDRPNGLRREL